MSDDDIPVGNAIAVLFCQLGGAIFFYMGQTVIITTILDLVPQRLPELPAAAVLAAGAPNLPTLVRSQEQLVALQEIWNSAVTRTMIMTTTVVGAAVPFTFGMDWLNAFKAAEEWEKAIIEATESEKTSDNKQHTEGGSKNPKDLPGYAKADQVA